MIARAMPFEAPPENVRLTRKHIANWSYEEKGVST